MRILSIFSKKNLRLVPRWILSIFSKKKLGLVPLVSVDSETKVPETLYYEFMTAAKRAKARGQHTLKRRRRSFLSPPVRILVRNS